MHIPISDAYVDMVNGIILDLADSVSTIASTFFLTLSIRFVRPDLYDIQSRNGPSEQYTFVDILSVHMI